MNVHEYQAKEILARYGVPVPEGELAESAEHAREIAARLHIAPVTVKTHLQNIYKKLNSKNRIEALKKSREIGIIIDK